ncbi:hypothetical protein Pyn_39126 [Prunus yedoensis var. nudiflora]|uniref:Terpene synthase N-terminal domain-containing protein n=1 Tax=Prunus yedoensis var. nudiflora TaxID=2094558 RepID=A0A314ZEI1_PRUYE|nr:hypothetical protein Pyn_39126 [Prunus yedoensis var. nudiflora]
MESFRIGRRPLSINGRTDPCLIHHQPQLLLLLTLRIPVVLLPTIYPLDNYARLTMVSSLESLGIDRHFREEITGVLDETYREPIVDALSQQTADSGCREMKIYFQMLPLVQWHFDSHVLMDMMFLQKIASSIPLEDT